MTQLLGLWHVSYHGTQLFTFLYTRTACFKVNCFPKVDLFSRNDNNAQGRTSHLRRASLSWSSLGDMGGDDGLIISARFLLSEERCGDCILVYGKK